MLRSESNHTVTREQMTEHCHAGPGDRTDTLMLYRTTELEKEELIQLRYHYDNSGCCASF